MPYVTALALFSLQVSGPAPSPAVLGADGPAASPRSFAQPSAPSSERSLTALAPAPRSRLALAHTAAIATTAATAVLAGLSGWLIPGLCFEAQGRPDPLCSGLGLLLGATVQVGLATLLVPETYRLANDASGRGDIGASRASGWRWSRWAALAGLLFVGTWLVGAAVEKTAYGKGQVPMLVGAAGTFCSWLAFDVTEVLGASAGYQATRREQP